MHKSISFLLCVTAIVFSTNAADKPSKSRQWEILFDGSSVEKWRGFKRDSFPEKAWKIEHGMLKTIPGGEVVDIITKEKYADFELELEWKISPAGNSGIIYRVSEDFPQTYNSGVEYQVLDDAKHADGKKPQTTAGAVYALIEPKGKKLKTVGKWNKTRLVAKGPHVEHWLNGNLVAEYDAGSQQFKDLIAASKFSKMPGFAKQSSGHIALQNHRDEVWYRNIRIRRL
jgi:hypothetical protein